MWAGYIDLGDIYLHISGNESIGDRIWLPKGRLEQNILSLWSFFLEKQHISSVPGRSHTYHLDSTLKFAYVESGEFKTKPPGASAGKGGQRNTSP